MGRRIAVIAVAICALCAGSRAAGAATPEINAVNALLQEGWTGYTADFEAASAASLKQTLEGTIAEGHGSIDGLKWSFDLKVKDVQPLIDLGPTPGFESMGDTGFTFGIPARGSWQLGVRGTIKGHAKVKAGSTTLFSWSPSFGFGLALPRFAVPLTVGIDRSMVDLPRLSSFSFLPTVRLVGEGLLRRLGLDLHGSGGSGSSSGKVSGDVNDLGLDLPGVSAGLTANLGIEFEPSQPIGSADVAADVEVAGKDPALHLHTAFEQARFRLHGGLSFKLPHLRRRHVPFDVNFVLAIPSSDTTNQLLLAVQGLGGGLPRRWGDDRTPQHPTPAPPATADADLATAADDIEDRIPAHLPFGAILSLDTTTLSRPRAGGPAGRAVTTTKYGLENDSAIFTGHYLAAEALRYADTRAPAALARVTQVLAGVERLAWVTQDAVIVGNRVRNRYSGQTTPAQGTFIARAAAPGIEADRFAEGSLRGGQDCDYVRPEGGWTVTRNGKSSPAATFADAVARAGAGATVTGVLPATASRPAPGRGATIAPVGQIWYGLGCGDSHPTSRDSVAGIALGLAMAHELVDDADVRSRTAALGSELVAYLKSHNWQITVPPGDAHGQNYWGLFDAQLALERLGATLDPGRFGNAYHLVAPAASVAWLPVWFSTLDPMAQYYKFNLGQAVLATALLLEHDQTIRNGYERAYRVLATPLRMHKNAWFDALDIFNRPADQRAAAAAAPAFTNPQITRADEIRSLLLSWERRRQLVKGPTGLPRNDIAHVDRLLALWPSDVGLYTTIDLKAHCLARYALDPENRIGNGMDFIWQRSPFDTGAGANHCNKAQKPSSAEIAENGAEPTREGPGVDFLLPYWMSVYTGAIKRQASTK